MKTREIIRLIEGDGWVLDRVTGSHHIYKHPLKKGTVVIPVHALSRDVPKGTAQSILKQAGLR